MLKRQLKTELTPKKWHLLLVYNLYRLVCVAVLCLVFWLNQPRGIGPILYFSALAGYALFGLGCLVFAYRKRVNFTQQILIAGTIDILVMVTLIYQVGHMHSGLGMLLYAYVALQSILIPGRLAFFFASLASFLLLGFSLIDYLMSSNARLSLFFSSGVYGAGFFATAITAWYLASWVESSERVAQEKTKELANLHRLNDYIVGRLHYGVVYVDSEGQIRVINSAALQLLGCDLQKHSSLLQEISPALFEKYQQFIAQKNEKSLNKETLLHDMQVQVHFISASQASPTAVLIILEDMAAIAQQAQQLKLASLGQFSAALAHELRNPLSSITYAAELMGEGGQVLDDENARLNALIVKNCQRMNLVIKNVLQVAKREQANPEKIALLAFLHHFKEEFCINNQLVIKIQALSSARGVVRFDKSQLEQVLVILCDNVLQHGLSQGVQAIICFKLREERQGVCLWVCDEGPGIASDVREKIFEPFFSTLKTGHGMGLFLAKELCEINQATLTLQESASGSCFKLQFAQDSEAL